MGDHEPCEGTLDVFSKSLASLLHLPSHANVRSTTQRRGNFPNPFALSERLMLSMVHSPNFDSSFFNFGPA